MNTIEYILSTHSLGSVHDIAENSGSKCYTETRSIDNSYQELFKAQESVNHVGQSLVGRLDGLSRIRVGHSLLKCRFDIVSTTVKVPGSGQGHCTDFGVNVGFS